jgi:hypothetical protein
MNRHGYDGRHPDICGVPDPQGNEHAPFMTVDGVTHKTWNAARKYLTGLSLLQTIKESGPDPVSVRDALMRDWHISRRSGPEGRAGGTSGAERSGDHDSSPDATRVAGNESVASSLTSNAQPPSLSAVEE